MFQKQFNHNVSIIHDITIIYYVAILVIQSKTRCRIGDLFFHHESRLGTISLPILDTLPMSQDHTYGQPLDPAGPVHKYFSGLVIPEQYVSPPFGT